MSKGSARDRLRALGNEIRTDYAANKRVMSMSEYLELVAARPHEQMRSAPQYIKGCFDHYGSEDVSYPWGDVRRFKIFDCPWADGRERLIGQEDVQNRVYRALSNFVNEGVSNKLILLHGPNGSAKSTLVRCIGRAMQDYSNRPEGAVYRINWIFPTQKVSKSGIGFSGGDYETHSDKDSYAYLPEEMIDAKLVDELRDHPLLLIPVAHRRLLIDEFLEGADAADNFVLSDYLLHGRLSHKNRAIYETLLTSYQGDYLKVLRHVQVERFYIRHRYREGYATVEPQLAVDANERQITADRSIAALPAALQSVSLYDYGGHLVAANRGLVEYSDLLKRPLEAFKYLITTVERSSVSLSNAILYLDVTFLGTTNEIHLSAFKEIAEFQSFKGRAEFIRVPYLLDFLQEQRIYQAKLAEAASSRHVAPHCAFVTALWAVLTRIRKPVADRYPTEISEVVAKVSPLEKAELYALGKVPAGLTSSQTRELTAVLGDMWRESEAYPNYEGRTGASPREMQAVIFNAATSTKYSYLSPMAILDEIGELIKQTSVYDFLKQEALPGGFHEHGKFIDVVRQQLIDMIDDEVRASMGLVEEIEYERVFERYLNHVTHWTKKEKVRNPTTGAFAEADAHMMAEIEAILGIQGDAGEFRHDLISRIGAWSIDNPSQPPDYDVIFADHFRKLRDAYYADQKKTVAKGIDELLHYIIDGPASVAEPGRGHAAETLAKLCSDFGYNDDSARDAVTVVARNRYAD